MLDAATRQSSLDRNQERRELQQVLIPESLPALPGFAFTSAYRPAQEVGGDFFQVIPLEGEFEGSTMILLGDVSGKGLKAAMTVSLIVGAARTLARFAPHPAEMLAELNLRLFGRLQGGFVTCLSLRLDAAGHCVVASAGHPAPFLNKREVDLPGTLPLGILPAASYEETAIDLREGDHFALYTDGLLEARSASGEIFSFERLGALFATCPDAAKATEAAVNFGQDDDITAHDPDPLGQRAAIFIASIRPALRPGLAASIQTEKRSLGGLRPSRVVLTAFAPMRRPTPDAFPANPIHRCRTNTIGARTKGAKDGASRISSRAVPNPLYP